VGVYPAVEAREGFRVLVCEDEGVVCGCCGGEGACEGGAEIETVVAEETFVDAKDALGGADMEPCYGGKDAEGVEDVVGGSLLGEGILRCAGGLGHWEGLFLWRGENGEFGNRQLLGC